MAIPNTSRELISGFPGNISHDGPTRAQPGILKSASESDNIFGRAFTYEDQGDETMEAGGAGVFAGIMINPKSHAIDTDYAKNGSVGEFLTMGEVYVSLVPAVEEGEVPDTISIGSKVYYTVTGELTVDATDKGDPNPVNHTQIVGAQVVRHLPSTADVTTGAQLAVISLTGPQPA